ncbi:hypothetical protein MKW98_026371 [Papaver atlanticum]|uniref:Uncharacterized protein n=1 Tax=Papaver atlanticum TaxID=357466 RepID=A0AAD4SQ19_9MAGN|nr:hypothetical protein MKW98_026371 [Papaver atlanticum]
MCIRSCDQSVAYVNTLYGDKEIFIQLMISSFTKAGRHLKDNDPHEAISDRLSMVYVGTGDGEGENLDAYQLEMVKVRKRRLVMEILEKEMNDMTHGC